MDKRFRRKQIHCEGERINKQINNDLEISSDVSDKEISDKESINHKKNRCINHLDCFGIIDLYIADDSKKKFF